MPGADGAGEDPADDAAMDGKPAVPGGDDLQKALVAVLVPLENDVVGARADDGADDDGDDEV